MLPHVKICGITSVEDAALAADHGAWAIGMIFWRGSSRRCEPEEAERIAAALRRRPVERVGVFVNATLDAVGGMAERAQLTILQLHGDEGPAFCAEAGRRTGCRVIKAARVATEADVRALRAFHTDFHLLDTRKDGLRGGTGETWEWSLAREHRSPVPLILSGGLTPENVGAGIAAVHPWAVDVASGVEAEPGRKDPARLAELFAAVRATAPEPEPAPEATDAAPA